MFLTRTVFLEIFTIRIEDQLDSFPKIFAYLFESLALGVSTRKLRDVAYKPAFFNLFENCCQREFCHRLLG